MRRYSIFSALLVLGSLFPACGGMPQMIGRVPLNLGPPQFENTTPLNIERTATVGEAIYITPMRVKTVPAFRVAEDFKPPNAGFTSFPIILKGTILTCLQTTTGQTDPANPDAYVCDTEGGLGQPMNGNVPVRGDYYLIVSRDGTPTGTIMGSMGMYWSEPPKTKFDFLAGYKQAIFGKDDLKQELVYGGKSGNTIKMSYREFSGNLARPAFTQELTYDLTESKEIGFRRMIIEVKEATNSKIKYTVKSGMTP
ncbi:MAG: hypothetical protein NUW14_04545 [Deltaproteobacteria bacterium]|nr:hypothetical protein [Deltaproteobacteria bacterium]